LISNPKQAFQKLYNSSGMFHNVWDTKTVKEYECRLEQIGTDWDKVEGREKK
jgi:hypothetical protein